MKARRMFATFRNLCLNFFIFNVFITMVFHNNKHIVAQSYVCYCQNTSTVLNNRSIIAFSEKNIQQQDMFVKH